SPRSVCRLSWRGRELRGVGNADRHADFSASMKERNFVRKEKFGRYCRRQDENSERHDSTQNLGERCCRFFRLFGLSGNDRGQWNSQLAADGLTPLDFRQAITHLVLEC